MNSIDELFGVDDEKENQGVWVEVKKGIAYLIAAHDREKHTAMFREKIAPLKTAIFAGVGNDDEAEKIAVECLAECVLLDWRGVIDKETGKEIKYTKEEGIKAMTTNRRFKEFVVVTSQKHELFRLMERDETLKNS